MERLRHVVHRAEVEAVHLGVDVVRAGEEDDRDARRRRVLLEAAAQVEAAVLGHVDVEEDQVGLHLDRQGEALFVRLGADEA